MDFDYLLELGELVRRRWNGRVLACLAGGPLRFGELASAIRTVDPDVGDSALTRALRTLDRAGHIRCHSHHDGTRLWALTRTGRVKAHRLLFLLSTVRDMDTQPKHQTPST